MATGLTLGVWRRFALGLWRAALRALAEYPKFFPIPKKKDHHVVVFPVLGEGWPCGPPAEDGRWPTGQPAVLRGGFVLLPFEPPPVRG